MGCCTAQCKMLLFCVKTIVKESHSFELAHLKKKEEENILVIWRLSGIFTMFFLPHPSSQQYLKMNGTLL